MSTLMFWVWQARLFSAPAVQAIGALILVTIELAYTSGEIPIGDTSERLSIH